MQTLGFVSKQILGNAIWLCYGFTDGAGEKGKMKIGHGMGKVELYSKQQHTEVGIGAGKEIRKKK
jgi:hypothetical protein